jgi:hypothetical protein
MAEVMMERCGGHCGRMIAQERARANSGVWRESGNPNVNWALEITGKLCGSPAVGVPTFPFAD